MKFQISTPIAYAHLAEQALRNAGGRVVSSGGNGQGVIMSECEIDPLNIASLLQGRFDIEFAKLAGQVKAPTIALGRGRS